MKIDDGYYTGTVINGMPNGFGRLAYNEGEVNHFTICEDTDLTRVYTKDFKFSFYEGCFKHGALNGEGVLV